VFSQDYGPFKTDSIFEDRIWLLLVFRRLQRNIRRGFLNGAQNWVVACGGCGSDSCFHWTDRDCREARPIRVDDSRCFCTQRHGHVRDIGRNRLRSLHRQPSGKGRRTFWQDKLPATLRLPVVDACSVSAGNCSECCLVVVG